MPAAVGDVQPPVFLPLHSMRKFILARAATLGPPVTTAMACVPLADGWIELLVMSIRFVASPGRPAFGTPVPVTWLLTCTWMPAVRTAEMLFWLMSALSSLKHVLAAVQLPTKLMPK